MSATNDNGMEANAILFLIHDKHVKIILKLNTHFGQQDTEKSPGPFIHPAKYILMIKNLKDKLI